MKYSKIEWTESTWNPTTGCTKISLGYKFCYEVRVVVNKRGKPEDYSKEKHGAGCRGIEKSADRTNKEKLRTSF